jgi:hypothetical protein
MLGLALPAANPDEVAVRSQLRNEDLVVAAKRSDQHGFIGLARAERGRGFEVAGREDVSPGIHGHSDSFVDIVATRALGPGEGAILGV